MARNTLAKEMSLLEATIDRVARGVHSPEGIAPLSQTTHISQNKGVI